ncbi:MAG: PHP domain-containing protein, partial [Halobacteriales archaeon]|nr:PHP domain-containing protein [Halobacteriales archaeon]
MPPSSRPTPYADLHLPTTVSDGQLPPERVALAARRAGLRAVAMTDHDRFHPDQPPVTRRAGVTIIHGIELRVDADQPVDLLGYGLSPTAELAAEVDRLSEDRMDRGRRIIDCVEDRLGVDLGLEARPGLGRPHIARAIAAHPGTDLDFQGAFDELIADGGPCYVARDVLSFDRGRELLSDACALVVLAHPLRYDDPEAALALAPALDGIELRYPY